MPALSPATDTATVVNVSAKSIIKRAVRILGGIASGEELSANELSEGLEALNQLIDSWNTESLLVYARVESTVTTANQNITIGPGGDIDIIRPSKIVQGDLFVVYSNVAKELDEMSREQWLAAEVLALSSIPGRFYYESAFPLGTIHLDWTPNQAFEFRIFTWQVLNQISNVSATFKLPPGYVRALVYDLAVELSPEYPNPGINLQLINDTAKYAKGNIKRVNNKTPNVQSDPALLGERAQGTYYKRIYQG